ncbi:acyltransferase [Porphyromonas sp.]|uniref:acyltransferase family protein n=1 Tax=Porphyromonas sp. TaxID=1924944 RepID=UPI0026DBE7F5|nr:acyltransferase [Porphyromonas sp.]MDO4770708.1 acyltransferase [Porphyromonas sp.]
MDLPVPIHDRKRSDEIDYIKSLLIILMIIFHLVYIGDKHPYLKAIVYTFHMSGFLMISGFLMNTKKDTKAVLNSLLWLFIPYAIMETGYVFMASILPIREHIDILTPLLLVDKIFLHPIGPYWYLHTLIICYVIWYLIDRFAGECLAVSAFWVIIALYALSHTGIISVDNALYFMLGALIRQIGLRFDKVFYATIWVIIPLVVLCYFPSNLNRGTFAGIVITYLAICFLLSLYPYLSQRAKRISQFVGRNTLPLLLFSPIFTLLSKPLVPVLSFDPTGLLFTAVAVVFTVMGSFTIAWLIDRSGLSRFFWGTREKFSWQGLELSSKSK